MNEKNGKIEKNGENYGPFMPLPVKRPWPQYLMSDRKACGLPE